MSADPSSIDSQEPKAKGRPKGASAADVEALQQRVDTLEQLIVRICAYSGTNHLLKEFGFERWNPTKDSMSKYAS